MPSRALAYPLRPFALPTLGRNTLMGRAYNVVDADGHVLEPLDLWDNYMEPRFRNRAPRLIKDKDGKERLVIEEQILGSAQAGLGGAGGVGARQGVVASNTMEYKEGRKGGFDPHARMPDMDADGIDEGAGGGRPQVGIDRFEGRGARHIITHTMEIDAGLSRGDLGRRLRATSEIAGRFSRIRRRLDRAVARPHGPSLR